MMGKMENALLGAVFLGAIGIAGGIGYFLGIEAGALMTANITALEANLPAFVANHSGLMYAIALSCLGLFCLSLTTGGRMGLTGAGGTLACITLFVLMTVAHSSFLGGAVQPSETLVQSLDAFIGWVVFPITFVASMALGAVLDRIGTGGGHQVVTAGSVAVRAHLPMPVRVVGEVAIKE